jgi:multiple sugar transport system substrate-binding protein
MALKIIGPNDPALDVLAAALAARPELNAELTIIPWAGYRDELMATLTADVASNQAVFVPGHIWLPELAAAGYLAELDELSAVVPSSVLTAYNPADIVPGIADECRYQGRQYQLPFFSDGHILFYRQDLIQLDDSAGVPVVSTRDLAELATAVHNPPHVYGLALKADGSEIFTDWLPYLWEAGGRIFDENGRPDIANPTNIEALELYCRLRQLCPPQTQAYGNGEIANSLRRGEAALVANWGGQTAPIWLDEGNEWREVYGTAVFPTPWNATWGIAIPKNQPEDSQETAVSTLMQLLGPEQDKEITRIAGSPVRMSSYAPAECAQYPWLAAQLEMLNRARPLPANPALGQFLGDLYGAVHQAFTGQLTPAEALRGVQTKAIGN